MVKNLQIYSEEKLINKKSVHTLISFLISDFQLSISSLSINFITSSGLRQINKKYLNHDFNTDIITFNYSDKKSKIDGEILISFEEAKINTKKYKVSYNRELLRLIIHGVLHLLDFDDNNRKNKIKMKRVENKLINKYNFILLEGKERKV